MLTAGADARPLLSQSADALCSNSRLRCRNLVVEAPRGAVVVGVVLIGTLVIDVVLIVHVRRVLPSLGNGELGVRDGVTNALAYLTLGLLAVPFIHPLGFCEPVDFSTGKAGQSLLGEGVGDGLACVCGQYNGVCLPKPEMLCTDLPCAENPRRA